MLNGQIGCLGVDYFVQVKPLLMTLIIGIRHVIACCASTIHWLVVDITLRHSKGWWHVAPWMLMFQLK